MNYDISIPRKHIIKLVYCMYAIEGNTGIPRTIYRIE